MANKGFYENYSNKIFWVAAGTALGIFTLLLVNKFWLGNDIRDIQLFFFFISLILLCISAVLHMRYKTMLKDPVNNLYWETEPADNTIVENNKKAAKKWMEVQQKKVYSNSIPFWIGLLFLIIALFFFFASSCGENNHASENFTDDGKLEVDLLQINDVYEIAGLDSGRIGGMARVATLKKQLLQKNRNTMLLMAGDFISPSVFNSVKQDGKRVNGKQMINVMNAAGVDLAVFGNHEFDFDLYSLQQRINESWFEWVASNVSNIIPSGKVPFKKNNTDIRSVYKMTFNDDDGTSFTVGFFGITTPDNTGGDPGYAEYDKDMIATAREKYNELSSSCDAVIAVTHLDLTDDKKLATEIPGLTAIIGGHEHDMQFEKVGNVYITKAHANAKSAFHLKIVYNKNNSPKVTVIPELVCIDNSIEEDCLTKSIGSKWMETAMQFFRDSGFVPDRIVCEGFNYKLDGRDMSVRQKQTNLTKLITDAMLAATKGKGTQIAMMNAGSIRVDDIINPPTTEYAFLRALPYGGVIYSAQMRGWFIKNLMDTAYKLQSQGGFIQYSDNVDIAKKTINGKPIDSLLPYTVAVTEYLMEGKEKKLGHVKEGTPGVVSVSARPQPSDSSLYDIRKAVIKYLWDNRKNRKVLEKYK